MLSREKVMPAAFRINRHNAVSLTYDMKNTSTKLILLNFANKNDNRIRGFEAIKEGVKCSQSTRNCQCLSKATSDCEFHGKDVNHLSSAKRHEKCFEDLNYSSQSQTLKTACNSKRKIDSNILDTRSEFKKDKNNEEVNLPSRNKRPVISARDLHILYSMPSLSHPGLTKTQKEVLFSLARIYTNVKPIDKITNNFLKTEHSRKSKEKLEKRSKKSLKSTNRKSNLLREDSLQTAVECLIENENENDNEEKTKMYCEDSASDSEILNQHEMDQDDYVEDLVKLVIDEQVSFLKKETNYIDGSNERNINSTKNTSISLEKNNIVPEMENKIENKTITDYIYGEVNSLGQLDLKENEDKMGENENNIEKITESDPSLGYTSTWRIGESDISRNDFVKKTKYIKKENNLEKTSDTEIGILEIKENKDKFSNKYFEKESHVENIEESDHSHGFTLTPKFEKLQVEQNDDKSSNNFENSTKNFIKENKIEEGDHSLNYSPENRIGKSEVKENKNNEFKKENKDFEKENNVEKVEEHDLSNSGFYLALKEK